MRKKANGEVIITSGELGGLRADIWKKTKEIEYLTMANKELKHVWKDTARRLKSLLKQLVWIQDGLRKLLGVGIRIIKGPYCII